MIKSIKKRDGRVVLYNEDKIAQAILKAMQASGEGDASDAAGVANSVEASLEKLCGTNPPTIEQIQDQVHQGGSDYCCPRPPQYHSYPRRV